FMVTHLLRRLAVLRIWVAGSFLLAVMPHASSATEIDTEHLFGFTLGSSIGEKGEKEVESETTARTGKGAGSYFTLAQQFEFKNTLTDNFRISAAAVFGYHDIGAVPDFDNRSRGTFQGLASQLAFRLVKPEHAPFGLSLFAEPHWARVDDLSGAWVENYGSTFTFAADRELIANKLFAAVNLIYDPEATRLLAPNTWMRQSTLGLSAAVAVQVKEAIFLGTELRAFTLYDGLAFDSFVGRALFAGPTLYAKLSERWWMSLAWNVQLAGHVVDRPSAFDMVNFERHQAKI